METCASGAGDGVPQERADVYSEIDSDSNDDHVGDYVPGGYANIPVQRWMQERVCV